ncbi:hypothetical protein OG470_12025 [Micromonospora sp. NBC_00389]|uniref:hypothetical protein n=1 Tax=Micromonospora sp. NBC_00389 TaxID=2903586 RepID=UPI002E1D4B6D
MSSVYRIGGVRKPGGAVDVDHPAVGGGRQDRRPFRQELVQDLLAIVHTFSCRLYGLRRYEKQLTSVDLTEDPA